MQSIFSQDTILKHLRMFSLRSNPNLTKTRFGSLLEQIRSLQKKNGIGKLTRAEKLKVPFLLIRQMSGSEQCNLWLGAGYLYPVW